MPLSIQEIEETTETTAVPDSVAAVGESMIADAEGYRVDLLWQAGLYSYEPLNTILWVRLTPSSIRSS